ncbi:hypothetical protein UPYG_G00354790 [Umbra pygmaea]|uniref:Rho-related GTP-binding protein RhoH n=1 Tax=Umbra pygmaea TaxID=75934 RepID=A0ABD0WBU3_UMBPY
MICEKKFFNRGINRLRTVNFELSPSIRPLPKSRQAVGRWMTTWALIGPNNWSGGQVTTTDRRRWCWIDCHRDNTGNYNTQGLNGAAMSTENQVKCVLVGDSAVGKTALLVRFTSETFPDGYKPTVYENTGVEVFMDGVPISLGLWDTAGNDTFRQIRPMSYQQADVVLICYSVANRASLASVKHKWLGEVREFLPNVPVLVVATQTDQREMGPHRAACSSAAEGKRLAQDVRAKGYLECSALSNRGVQQVFECAVRTAVNQAKKRTRRRIFDINECVMF